jgi:basic amino acid/polyamine antiporter, APA family
VYYAIANAAALTQTAAQRRWPRALQVVGIGGCIALVATLPWLSLLAGGLMFAVGLAGRWLVRARRARVQPTDAS